MESDGKDFRLSLQRDIAKWRSQYLDRPILCLNTRQLHTEGPGVHFEGVEKYATGFPMLTCVFSVEKYCYVCAYPTSPSGKRCQRLCGWVTNAHQSILLRSKSVLSEASFKLRVGNIATTLSTRLGEQVLAYVRL